MYRTSKSSDRDGVKFNIVGQPRSGIPTGLVDYKLNNKYTVLSIKASDYGKDHENRESVIGREIPSKLN